MFTCKIRNRSPGKLSSRQILAISEIPAVVSGRVQSQGCIEREE